MQAFAEGKHIVIGDRGFFSSIIEEDVSLFSRITKNYASEALRSQLEYSALLMAVNFYIRVDFNLEGEAFNWQKDGNHYILVVGPHYFDDTVRLQLSNIIFENVKDSDFYQVIVAYFAKRNKAVKCGLKFNAINGGGGSTKDVFDRTVRTKIPVLCILDSDKKHPLGPMGSTSRAFSNEVFSQAGMVYTLEVQEVESLIPTSTLALLNDKAASKLSTIAFLENIANIDETSKFYFDHKKGLTLVKALELDKIYGPYWIPFIRSTYSAANDCLINESCNCHTACIIYEGFGDNILDRVIDFISRGNLRAYEPRLSPLLENQWNIIGKLLFSWACSPVKKIRAS